MNLSADESARLIAFYLPQYHPIPENDAWWGKGFTEWANVAKAKPCFTGHHQPHLPGELGFYDLRLDEVREQQAELARQYGIYGFCYHYYWFAGKRLLHRPIDAVLTSGQPRLPFCLCWANENWTRAWDGAAHDVLIAQQYSEDDTRAFIRGLFPFFSDSRYIRISGRPLLVVYRIALIPNIGRIADLWREECLSAGLALPYLCCVQNYGFAEDPRSYGFDAALEFPPHNVFARSVAHAREVINPFFRGQILSYRIMALDMMAKSWPDYKIFRGVVPRWDSTPRRPDDGTVFVESSPEAYQLWLADRIEQTCARYRGDERIVFINAWNEWGEGCHLEPDSLFGHKYLEATKRALLRSGYSTSKPRSG